MKGGCTRYRFGRKKGGSSTTLLVAIVEGRAMQQQRSDIKKKTHGFAGKNLRREVAKQAKRLDDDSSYRRIRLTSARAKIVTGASMAKKWSTCSIVLPEL